MIFAWSNAWWPPSHFNRTIIYSRKHVAHKHVIKKKYKNIQHKNNQTVLIRGTAAGQHRQQVNQYIRCKKIRHTSIIGTNLGIIQMK